MLVVHQLRHVYDNFEGAMKEKTDIDVDLVVGGWYRFSHYDLHAGYIRPGQDARLESYNPWAEYRHVWKHSKKKETPLARLCGLYSELGYPTRGADLDEEGVARVLNWCQEFGLMGILLQSVKLIVLIPPGRFTNYSVKGHPKTKTRSTYLRTSMGWLHQVDSVSPGDSEEQYTLSSPVGESDLIRNPINEIWGKYFPGIDPDDYFKFVPSQEAEWNERYWRSYAEPIDDFITAVGILNRALEVTACIEDNNWPDGKAEAFNQGLITLHALTDGVSPVLIPSENNFEQRWSSPSLLSSLAMMALQDNVGSRHLRKCVCGRLFVTSKALYCSSSCARTKQQEVRRLRHLVTLERYLEGIPPDEIAIELGSKTATIKGWIKNADKVWKLKEKGFSSNEISEKSGLAKNVVEHWIRDMKKAKKHIDKGHPSG